MKRDMAVNDTEIESINTQLQKQSVQLSKIFAQIQEKISDGY